MTGRRTEALFYGALEYISSIVQEQELYDCLHGYLGMTNAEIEESGYGWLGCRQEDTLEQTADASGNRYKFLEQLESQSRLAVEYVVAAAGKSTGEEPCRIPYDEVENQLILYGKGNLFFRNLVGEMLRERKEIASLQMGKDCFKVEYAPDYCKKRAEQPEESAAPFPEMKL